MTSPPPPAAGDAATVSTPKASYLLYASYFFAAWGDRMWEFAGVIFLLEIFPDTLLPASLFGFFASVCGILVGPTIGSFIDHNDRLKVIRTSCIGQNVTVALASILFYVSLVKVQGLSFTVKVICLICFIIAEMVAKVFSSMNKISIHKDWVVVVAGGNRAVQTRLNASMRRVDLTCSIVAPLLVGILSSAFGPPATCLFIASWAACSLFVEFYLNGVVYHGDERLRQPKAAVVAAAAAAAAAMTATVASPTAAPPADSTEAAATTATAPAAVTPPPSKRMNPLESFKNNISLFRAYVNHRSFLISLPYCMLYMSILSFSGIVVSYLRTLGVSDVMLAVGRGIAALVAVGSTFVIPQLVKWRGLRWTGKLTIWAQILCLIPVAVAFLITPSYEDQKKTAFIVLLFAAICSSRFGLWGFDLAQTQLMQELVEHEVAGRINGSQDTLMNVCYLISFTFTVIFHKPSQFTYPVLLSFLSVLSAGILFTCFAGRTGSDDEGSAPKVTTSGHQQKMTNNATNPDSAAGVATETNGDGAHQA